MAASIPNDLLLNYSYVLGRFFVHSMHSRF